MSQVIERSDPVDQLAAPTAPPGMVVRLGRARVRVVGPSWRDQRLHVAATIVTLQVLGQTVLGFEVSIAQILICLATCAAIDLVVAGVRDHAIVWPGSALLTGNGVALIFRVNGTEHGDWWSTRGGWMFAACAAVSVLSKYAIRVGDRHLFNPSNLGLVVCFVVFGTERVNPLDFWWGQWSAGMALAYAVIVVGGITLVRRVHMVGLALTFWLVFAAALAVVAAGGHSINARWHVGPVSDWSFWLVVALSPEILVFLFFMITDPRTAPRGRVARLAYAATVALACVALAAPQRTEFATKVAVLAGLLVGCALRPAFERWCPEPGTAADRPLAALRRIVRGPDRRPVGRPSIVRPGLAVASIAVVAVALTGLASPAREPLASAGVSVDVAVLQERPDVAIAAADRPAVTISDGAADLNGRLGRAGAERLVLDVLEDLEIESRAGDAADVDLAATAVAGDRLDEFTERVADGSVPIDDTLRARRATVVAVRDPANPQAVPRLGVELWGIDASGGSVHTIFVTIRAGAHHLVIEERTP